MLSAHVLLSPLHRALNESGDQEDEILEHKSRLETGVFGVLYTLT
jgi:hypothetical protein